MPPSQAPVESLPHPQTSQARPPQLTVSRHSCLPSSGSKGSLSPEHSMAFLAQVPKSSTFLQRKIPNVSKAVWPSPSQWQPSCRDQFLFLVYSLLLCNTLIQSNVETKSFLWPTRQVRNLSKNLKRSYRGTRLPGLFADSCLANVLTHPRTTCPGEWCHPQWTGPSSINSPSRWFF